MASVRIEPSLPLNKAEAALVAERRHLVRSRMRADLSGPAVMYSVDARNRALAIARAEQAASDLTVLNHPWWRKVTRELRWPAAVFAWRYTGTAVAWDAFPVTTETSTGLTVVTDPTVGMGTMTQAAVLKGLEIFGGMGAYASHHDPYWGQADHKLAAAAMALVWDRADVSSWTDPARKTAVSTWYAVMLGAWWWFASDASRKLTVDGVELDNDAALDWLARALDAWPDPQALYPISKRGVYTRMQSRMLCQIDATGQSAGVVPAVNEARWREWRFTSYQAALAKARE